MIRILFAGAGAVQIAISVYGGVQEPAHLMMGGMAVVVAATNFCSQCPLISAVKRMIGPNKRKTINTEKI